MLPERIKILQDRARMLSLSRQFFSLKNIIEVDCPLASARASVDAHIDLIPISSMGEKRYLHSSPEYGMKRLLAEGIGDCYQISHVFREGEYGLKHNPEFTLVEWYRLKASFAHFIEETLDFIRLFLGDIPATFFSYRQAFEKYLEIDPFQTSLDELEDILHKKGVHEAKFFKKEGKDALLNLLLATFIEPHLGKEGLCVLAYYPSSQAALAKTNELDGHLVACRFEVYYQGVELANGYDELCDPQEQRKRLKDANLQRLSLGKDPLPIDELFLQALEKGLPSCCGVAVGFDRLMMLRHQKKKLSDVLTFDWISA